MTATFSVADVAAAHKMTGSRVRNYATSIWSDYVLPKATAKSHFVFHQMPPAITSFRAAKAPKVKAPASIMPPLSITEALRKRIGTILPAGRYTLNGADETDFPLPEPGEAMILHAMYWGSRGFPVFPCQRFLGDPLFGEMWYGHGKTAQTEVIAMWAKYPDADIGVDIDACGCFVIEIANSHGGCLDDLGPMQPVFESENFLGDRRLWFPGRVATQLNKLGSGIHLIGIGGKTYLPPSLTPGYM
jgi:Bifunctional DNA primase/polymerase, N-terminal